MMKHSDVAEAHELLRHLRDIDRALKDGSDEAKLAVVTMRIDGRDSTTDIRLPSVRWRAALGAYRAELVERLVALGVEMEGSRG